MRVPPSTPRWTRRSPRPTSPRPGACGAALDTLAADAPAIFLYTPQQRAAVARRIGGVEINSFSWLVGVEKWTVDVRGGGR
jgi:hypothetical protein